MTMTNGRSNGRGSEQHRRDVMSAFAESERNINLLRQQGDGGASASPLTLIRGQITDVIPANDSYLYDARGYPPYDGITVDRQAPMFRQLGSEIKIGSPAQVGTLCFITIEDNTYKLAFAREKFKTAACQEQLNNGTTESVITSYDLNPTNIFAPDLSFEFDVSFSVSASTQEQYGALLYTFPVGQVAIMNSWMDATISAPSITQKIRLSLATSDATGQTGTNFTSSYEDIVLNVQSVNLSSSGAAYERPSPVLANVANDVQNMHYLRDGRSAGIPIYLNISQIKAGGWDASEAVRVQGTLNLNIAFLGGTA